MCTISKKKQKTVRVRLQFQIIYYLYNIFIYYYYTLAKLILTSLSKKASKQTHTSIHTPLY